MFQVKWFNKKKGYGFVIDETGNEYFCHHSDIDITGYKYLRQGEYISGVIEDMPQDNKQKVAKIKPPVEWGKLMCQVELERNMHEKN
jgi:cold shock protein|tara:strand:- start:647 stop:907 length:261 start_codon:yes stop_codon:yes gene_type:complete